MVVHLYRSAQLRHGRCSLPGGIYLITVCVAQRRRAFFEWAHAQPVVRAMQAEAKAGSASTLAWVLMPDHFHWLLQLGNADLNHVLRRLKSRSTLEFKRAHEWPWPLWQKHFYDRALRMDEDVVAAARYVICNPLRAGLVERMGQYCLWDAVWV